jgi:hypothetical protein
MTATGVALAAQPADGTVIKRGRFVVRCRCLTLGGHRAIER